MPLKRGLLLLLQCPCQFLNYFKKLFINNELGGFVREEDGCEEVTIAK
jgi:hypothetical protein